MAFEYATICKIFSQGKGGLPNNKMNFHSVGKQRWGGIIRKQNMFSVPGHIVQVNIHIINLSAAKDEYYLEENKTFKKKKRQEKKSHTKLTKFIVI